MKDFNSKDGKRPSASFVIGAVALLFLIVGYQAALFIHKAAVARVIANYDEPDTVFVYERMVGDDSAEGDSSRSLRQAQRPKDDRSLSSSKRPEQSKRQRRTEGPYKTEGRKTEYYRKDSKHSPAAETLRRNHTERKYESFPFDPNTVSVDDLMRLGFSQKQAQSIDNYRKKGGRFRRKSDFARSYVVEDSVFQRLEKYIDIPKIDINSADSAALMSLPGIGKFFAGKIVSYRRELGGYSYPEQLMDIWHFDREKYDNLKDLIKLDTLGIDAYPLWSLSEAELARHPYIGKRPARGIVLFRENSPKSDWTVVNLQKAGILDPDKAAKLSRCRISKP